jgi:hypothetical protein
LFWVLFWVLIELPCHAQQRSDARWRERHAHHGARQAGDGRNPPAV